MKNKKTQSGMRNGCKETTPVPRGKPGKGEDKSRKNVKSKGNSKISEPNEKDNTHNRDINSKSIFRNPVLCAQFLRDNCDIPALKHVRPEDIEDISERYLPYLGTEFDSDSVKKIRILDISHTTEENSPPFLVSLINQALMVN